MENAPVCTLFLQPWALSNRTYQISEKQYPKAHRPSTALKLPISPLINVMPGFPMKMFQIRIPLQGY